MAGVRRTRPLAGRLLVAGLAGLVVLLVVSPVSAAQTYRENPSDRSTFDPYFPEQWGLTAIEAPQAWTKSTGAGVVIGVVDTGIDLSHEDLAAKVVASTNCIGSEGFEGACIGSAQDDQGHGTAVAGIAAAITDNAKGVAGVAPDAKLLIVKALGSAGSGSLIDVDTGIEWAVDHGARVINLSLEADGSQLTVLPGESLSSAVDYAWQHGAIPVIAAGNSTPSLFGVTGYAGIDAVIVGATGRDNGVAWYSSPFAGARWGVVAPGGDGRAANGAASCAGALAADCIVSTGWFVGHTNSYADDEGTSMATPVVSGVLALLLAEGLSPLAAIARLLATTDKINCGASCAGLVDAAAAVGAPATLPAFAPPPSIPSASASASATTAGTAGAQAALPQPTPAPPPTDMPSTSLARLVPPVSSGVAGSPSGAGRPRGSGGLGREDGSIVALGPGRPSSHHSDDQPVAVVIAAVLLVLLAIEAVAVSSRERRRGRRSEAAEHGDDPTEDGHIGRVELHR